MTTLTTEIKFVTFTRVQDAPQRPQLAQLAQTVHMSSDEDEGGEDDGLVAESNVVPGPGADAVPAQPSPQLIALRLDTIRNFYPRTKGRTGTRIILTDGTAYPVQENFDEVLAKVNA